MKLYKFFVRYALILFLCTLPGLLILNVTNGAQEEVALLEKKWLSWKGLALTKAEKKQALGHVTGSVLLLLVTPGLYKLTRIGIFSYKTNGATLHVISNEEELGAFIANDEHRYLPIGLSPFKLKLVNYLPPFQKDNYCREEHLEADSFAPRHLLIIPRSVKLNLKRGYRDHSRYHFPFLLLGWDEEFITAKEERYQKMATSYKQGKQLARALKPKSSEDGVYDTDYTVVEGG